MNVKWFLEKKKIYLYIYIFLYKYHFWMIHKWIEGNSNYWISIQSVTITIVNFNLIFKDFHWQF